MFLIGDMDHVLLREMLATNICNVELHDCDEYIKNEEGAKVAIFSAGKAKFTFRDFLRKNCLELKLRSDVFPLKRDEVDNTKNLDLNTTARKGEIGPISRRCSEAGIPEQFQVGRFTTLLSRKGPSRGVIGKV